MNTKGSKKGKERSDPDVGDGLTDDAEQVDGTLEGKVRKKPIKALNYTARGSTGKVYKLFQQMSPTSKKQFSESCFGHFLNIQPFTCNRTLMAAVLRRYVKWDIFDLKGRDVRCSLKDIALITGLDVTRVVNPVLPPSRQGPDRLRTTILG